LLDLAAVDPFQKFGQRETTNARLLVSRLSGGKKLASLDIEPGDSSAQEMTIENIAGSCCRLSATEIARQHLSRRSLLGRRRCHLWERLDRQSFHRAERHTRAQTAHPPVRIALDLAHFTEHVALARIITPYGAGENYLPAIRRITHSLLAGLDRGMRDAQGARELVGVGTDHRIGPLV
jgi:hypothetical protein